MKNLFPQFESPFKPGRLVWMGGIDAPKPVDTAEAIQDRPDDATKSQISAHDVIRDSYQKVQDTLGMLELHAHHANDGAAKDLHSKLSTHYNQQFQLLHTAYLKSKKELSGDQLDRVNERATELVDQIREHLTHDVNVDELDTKKVKRATKHEESREALEGAEEGAEHQHRRDIIQKFLINHINKTEEGTLDMSGVNVSQLAEYIALLHNDDDDFPDLDDPGKTPQALGRELKTYIDANMQKILKKMIESGPSVKVKPEEIKMFSEEVKKALKANASLSDTFGTNAKTFNSLVKYLSKLYDVRFDKAGKPEFFINVVNGEVNRTSAVLDPTIFNTILSEIKDSSKGLAGEEQNLADALTKQEDTAKASGLNRVRSEVLSGNDWDYWGGKITSLDDLVSNYFESDADLAEQDTAESGGHEALRELLRINRKVEDGMDSERAEANNDRVDERMEQLTRERKTEYKKIVDVSLRPVFDQLNLDVNSTPDFSDNKSEQTINLSDPATGTVAAVYVNMANPAKPSFKLEVRILPQPGASPIRPIQSFSTLEAFQEHIGTKKVPKKFMTAPGENLKKNQKAVSEVMESIKKTNTALEKKGIEIDTSALDNHELEDYASETFDLGDLPIKVKGKKGADPVIVGHVHLDTQAIIDGLDGKKKLANLTVTLSVPAVQNLKAINFTPKTQKFGGLSTRLIKNAKSLKKRAIATSEKHEKVNAMTDGLSTNAGALSITRITDHSNVAPGEPVDVAEIKNSAGKIVARVTAAENGELKLTPAEGIENIKAHVSPNVAALSTYLEANHAKFKFPDVIGLDPSTNVDIRNNLVSYLRVLVEPDQFKSLNDAYPGLDAVGSIHHVEAFLSKNPDFANLINGFVNKLTKKEDQKAIGEKPPKLTPAHYEALAAAMGDAMQQSIPGLPEPLEEAMLNEVITLSALSFKNKAGETLTLENALGEGSHYIDVLAGKYEITDGPEGTPGGMLRANGSDAAPKPFTNATELAELLKPEEKAELLALMAAETPAEAAKLAEGMNGDAEKAKKIDNLRQQLDDPMKLTNNAAFSEMGIGELLATFAKLLKEFKVAFKSGDYDTIQSMADDLTNDRNPDKSQESARDICYEKVKGIEDLSKLFALYQNPQGPQGKTLFKGLESYKNKGPRLAIVQHLEKGKGLSGVDITDIEISKDKTKPIQMFASHNGVEYRIDFVQTGKEMEAKKYKKNAKGKFKQEGDVVKVSNREDLATFFPAAKTPPPAEVGPDAEKIKAAFTSKYGELKGDTFTLNKKADADRIHDVIDATKVQEAEVTLAADRSGKKKGEIVTVTQTGKDNKNKLTFFIVESNTRLEVGENDKIKITKFKEKPKASS